MPETQTQDTPATTATTPTPDADPAATLTPQERKTVQDRAKAREAREAAGDGATRPIPEVLGALSADGDVSPEEAVDAVEWFLSDEVEDDQATITINVGTVAKPKKILWTIRAIDADTIKRARTSSAKGSRQQRRAGTAELDDSLFNAAIVAAGTVEPDLQQIAAQMGAPTIAAMLLRRFSHKPGLIGQISGEIMGLSGFDDEDVAEVEAGKL